MEAPARGEERANLVGRRPLLRREPADRRVEDALLLRLVEPVGREKGEHKVMRHHQELVSREHHAKVGEGHLERRRLEHLQTVPLGRAPRAHAVGREQPLLDGERGGVEKRQDLQVVRRLQHRGEQRRRDRALALVHGVEHCRGDVARDVGEHLERSGAVGPIACEAGIQIVRHRREHDAMHAERAPSEQQRRISERAVRKVAHHALGLRVAALEEDRLLLGERVDIQVGP